MGYDAVNLPAATAQGLAVTIAPGTNDGAVAEHAFTLILALAKRPSATPGRARGRWPRVTNKPLRGQTLGIAGMGRIGKAMAVRGAALNALAAYDPFPDHAFAAAHNVAASVPGGDYLRKRTT